MRKKPLWSIIGLVSAVVALVGAIFGFDIAERISPAPPVEERIADTAVRIRDAVVAKLKDRDAKIPRREEKAPLHRRIFEGSLVLAVFGVVSSGIGYSRREDRRIAVAAGSIAVVSLAWHMLMIAIGAIALLVIIAVVSSVLGATPG